VLATYHIAVSLVLHTCIRTGCLERATNVAAGLPITLSEVRHDSFQFLQTNVGQLTPQSVLRI